ncbi:ATP-binding cassette domain-containing protein, partial [Faecalibaculum rodentium]
MKIECRDLVKTYKTVQAMDGLTLTVPEGQILGLLGKNGQGKSTLIKTLAGVIRPDSGTVILDGQIPGTATKARVSWLPELSGLDLSWSVRQTLNFWQDFFPDFNRSRADEMLKQLNLVPDMRLREMSKGMREKLQLVLVMARDADL